MKCLFSTLLIALIAFSSFASQAFATVHEPALDGPVHPRLDLSTDFASVRAELAVKRAMQLERVRAYSNAGVFPDNNDLDQPLTVFIDQFGVLCAFAHLLWEDGQDASVRYIAATNNHLLVGDLRHGTILDWILESGLTHEEAALIQVPGFEYERPILEKVPSIQSRLQIVLNQLEQNTNASLDTATERLIAKRLGER